MSLTRTGSTRAGAFADRERQGWGSAVLGGYGGSASNPGRRSMGRIAILGNYPPRQCGIATFTADLANALFCLDPDLAVHVIAMNDRDHFSYPNRVRYEIRDTDRASYERAAHYINGQAYDVLSVQHEYGIFGGDTGFYLLDLVRNAKVPVVTTLHTVSDELSVSQKATMDELLRLSERVVVMSQKAISLLNSVHGIRPEKIDLIPHGIPDIQESAGREFRSKLGIAGPMILTFGLLSPSKGIEYVIEAMPKIVREHPGATYFVVGATHPNVRSKMGETYRESLLALARDLGVASNVRFVDRFVAIEELVQYLAAMDIYVTPYLNPKQITSGTLAYAVGAGKAVISTPYRYAEELLADGRGTLVPFHDGDAIAEAVLGLQCEPELTQEMRRRAGEFGKQMLWPKVGEKYLASFARAGRDSSSRLNATVARPRLTGLSPAADAPSAGFVANSRISSLDSLSNQTKPPLRATPQGLAIMPGE